jgi:hypothetical protein
MKRLTLAAAIYIVTAASSTYAHHSHPWTYNWCKTLTIEGRVEKVEFKEPHTLISLRLDDGTLWTVDWAGLRGLTNGGWLDPAKASVVLGARITVTGAPIRTLAEIRTHLADYKGPVNPNTIDPVLIRRADNSWTWTLNSLPGPDSGNCKAFK